MNNKNTTHPSQKYILQRYAFLAVPLSFLGLPLYMHLPKFYHDTYGASLLFIGMILFASRLLDAVVDPLLGVISDRLNFTRKKYFIIFTIGLTLSFNGFFYIPDVKSTNFIVLWFGLCTLSSYFFYSLILINYFSLGLHLATTAKARVSLSALRELFSFVGILLAATLPALMQQFFFHKIVLFKVYGAIFAFIILIASFSMPAEKTPYQHMLQDAFNFKKIFAVWRYKPMCLILLLFFTNSLPVAITANLFNFYVADVLGLEKKSALLLFIYFFNASLGALSISNFFKPKQKTQLLQRMMILSACGFALCCFLNENNNAIFYGVCIICGFAMGGELVLFSALAADIVSMKNTYSNTFFGIWTSCGKISLAVASGVFLPLVTLSDNLLMNASKANKLTFMYAFIPLVLKFLTIIFLTSQKELLSHEQN